MNAFLKDARAFELLERLPVTLELLAGSIAIALAIGVASSFVASRARGSIVAGVNRWLAMSLGSIPFFWLALVLALVALLRWGHSILGWASADRFSVRDNLVHLIAPACVVALAELPIIWKALERFQHAGDDWKTDLTARAALSLRELAWRLPEVMGACLLTEMAFGWPGEGRLFLNAVLSQRAAPAVGVVLLVAILTLLARGIAGAALRTGCFENRNA